MAAGSADLNLIPYLDIVVTLTVAMFAMAASVSELYQAPVSAPPLGHGSGAGLALDVRAAGIEVRSGDERVLLPRDGDSWPYARLTETLEGLRAAGEDSATLTVSADPALPYDVLIATMDAARGTKEAPLYPAVALAVAKR